MVSVSRMLTVTLVLLAGAFPHALAQEEAIWDGGPLLACSPEHSAFLVRFGTYSKQKIFSLVRATSPVQGQWGSYRWEAGLQCKLGNGETVEIIDETDSGYGNRAGTIRLGGRKLYYGYTYKEGFKGAPIKLSSIGFDGDRLIECAAPFDNSIKPIPISCTDESHRLSEGLSQAEIERLAIDREKARLAKAASPFCRGLLSRESFSARTEATVTWKSLPPNRTLNTGSNGRKTSVDTDGDGKPETVYKFEDTRGQFWDSSILIVKDRTIQESVEAAVSEVGYSPDEVKKLVASHPEWNAILFSRGKSTMSGSFFDIAVIDQKTYVIARRKLEFSVSTRTLYTVSTDGLPTTVCRLP